MNVTKPVPLAQRAALGLCRRHALRTDLADL
jgi:hypothetical protein